MDEARTTVDLNGTYRFKTDAKGRVSLPAKFRKVLSDDLVVACSLTDDYLQVFDGAESFNAWVEQIFADKYGKYNSTSREQLYLRSVLKGRAYEVQTDSAGRILLPAELRAQVGIQKEVVIVGNTGYFEVWSAERRSAVVDTTDIGSLLS
ncbi:MAG: division/cell wall cluster transcriptional repressor MraZ [Eggerthellaceae bacterium]|nr:division/cell wall cluster transcriptional repressor MraZ [Eggerthellaceae bacterium]